MRFLLILILFPFILSANTNMIPAPQHRPPVIGIVAVDSDELGELVSFMDTPVETITKGMRKAYRGKLWGLSTVIFLANVGKPAGASAIVDMALEHHVNTIILIGAAAALDNRLNIGDIVIPQALLDVDVDFRPFAPLFEIPLLTTREFPTHARLRALAIHAAEEFIRNDLPQTIDKTLLKEMYIDQPKLVQAMTGTTDSFLLSNQAIQNLKSKAPKVVAIDMEDVSMAQTAKDYGIPFVVIRTISNYVDTPTLKGNQRVALDYMGFLKNVQSAYSHNILKQLYSRIESLSAPIHPIKKSEITKFAKQSIGILCTVPSEAKFLTQLFEGSVQEYTMGTRTYYQGKFSDGMGGVIVASGIGKSAAAATAAHLILAHRVDQIINTGTTTSLFDHLNLGDVVISQNLIQHDVDVRPFRPIFQLSVLGITEIPSDREMQKKLREITLELGLKSVVGQMASSDRVLQNMEEIDFLKAQLPTLTSVDSESASVAQIAYQYGIPFAAVKTVAGYNQHVAPLGDSAEISKMHQANVLEILKNWTH